MNSPPFGVIQAVPFEEKSGADADDCAAAPTVSAAQASTARAPPASWLVVESNLAIMALLLSVRFRNPLCRRWGCDSRKDAGCSRRRIPLRAFAARAGNAGLPARAGCRYPDHRWSWRL